MVCPRENGRGGGGISSSAVLRTHPRLRSEFEEVDGTVGGKAQRKTRDSTVRPLESMHSATYAIGVRVTENRGGLYGRAGERPVAGGAPPAANGCNSPPTARVCGRSGPSLAIPKHAPMSAIQL